MVEWDIRIRENIQVVYLVRWRDRSSLSLCDWGSTNISARKRDYGISTFWISIDGDNCCMSAPEQQLSI